MFRSVARLLAGPLAEEILQPFLKRHKGVALLDVAKDFKSTVELVDYVVEQSGQTLKSTQLKMLERSIAG